MTDRLGILGVGLWTPDHADLASWLEGRANASPPRARIVPPLLRRRLSPLAGAMIDALTESLSEDAQRTNLRGVPGRAAGGRDDVAGGPVDTIFGSAYGETSVLVELLDQIERGDGPSPTGFASSVHNAASGYYSIATHNRGFATSVAAGHDTLAASLFEAFGRIHAGAAQVLVVVGDLAAPSALVPEALRGPPLAAALHLASAEHAPLGHLSFPARVDGRSVIPERYAHNPCAAALGLVDAIARARPGPIRLDAHGSGWTTHFESPS